MKNRSEEIANQFMADGRTGTGDHSDSYESSVCNPQNVQTSPFDLQGRINKVPADVDYDMKPMRKNPRSVSDQTTPEDAQGK